MNALITISTGHDNELKLVNLVEQYFNNDFDEYLPRAFGLFNQLSITYKLTKFMKKFEDKIV